MEILYICDKLITFILNEIVALKQKNHTVHILSEDAQQIHVVINNPILIKYGLDDSYETLCTFSTRTEKYICFIKSLIHDFFVYPKYTLKSCFYMFKYYPHPKYGIVDYLHVRGYFKSGIDVIYAPFSSPKIIDKVYLLSRVINVPYILCFRAHDLYHENNFIKATKRIDALKRASRIITIADFNKKYMEGIMQFDKDVKVVRSALNVDLFKPAHMERSNESIITISRLSEEKGINYLIEACHILHKRKINYECTIIGDGPEKSKYEKLISKLQIPNVNFTGYLSSYEIKEHLNRCTVFVLPSIVVLGGYGDILSNAVKEAMAMQVPVISSDIRSIEELIDDGINGILVPQKKPEAIADAIEEIFNSPDLGRKIGEEGRKKIEDDFNILIEIGKLEEIFREAVNHHSKALISNNKTLTERI